MNHGPEHERLLHDLLATEPSDSAREVPASLRDCAVCAREWNEVRHAVRSLERTSARMTSALAAMDRSAKGVGESAAEEALRAEISRSRRAPQADAASVPTTGAPIPGKPPLARRRWLWLSLAAAVLLIGAIAFFQQGQDDRGRELMGRVRASPRPIESVAGGGLRFAWSGDVPSDHSVEAEIEGRADERAAWAPVAMPPGSPKRARVPAGGWVAGPDVVGIWPRELRWRVVLLDVVGGTQGESDWSPIYHLR